MHFQENHPGTSGEVNCLAHSGSQLGFQSPSSPPLFSVSRDGLQGQPWLPDLGKLPAEPLRSGPPSKGHQEGRQQPAVTGKREEIRNNKLGYILRGNS